MGSSTTSDHLTGGSPRGLQVLGLDLDPLSYAIAFPFDSPLRRKLDIALVGTMRSSWWREVVRRDPGPNSGSQRNLSRCI